MGRVSTASPTRVLFLRFCRSSDGNASSRDRVMISMPSYAVQSDPVSRIRPVVDARTGCRLDVATLLALDVLCTRLWQIEERPTVWTEQQGTCKTVIKGTCRAASTRTIF
jgi:hypothetical protein